MMRYFFTLHDHKVETDDTGIELPDEASARAEAIRFAGEVLRDEPEMIADGTPLSVQVSDETGAEPFRVEIRAIRSH